MSREKSGKQRAHLSTCTKKGNKISTEILSGGGSEWVCYNGLDKFLGGCSTNLCLIIQG